MKARLDTPWGRREVAQAPDKEATWLDIALVEKMPEALRPLVEAGVDVNGTTDDFSADSALIYAAGNGDYQSVRELLMLGASKNQKNKVGFSAYNAAANSGHGDLAMELAEQGVQRDTNTGPMLIRRYPWLPTMVILQRCDACWSRAAIRIPKLAAG